MKTTFCIKISTETIHEIDKFCEKNKITRSEWGKIAIRNQLFNDNIPIPVWMVPEKVEKTRQIKSKIEKK